MLKNSSSLYEDQLNVSQGDMLWLWDQIEDPQIDPNTQQVIGYYRAKSMIDTKDTNKTTKEKEKEKEKEEKEEESKKQTVEDGKPKILQPLVSKYKSEGERASRIWKHCS